VWLFCDCGCVCFVLARMGSFYSMNRKGGMGGGAGAHCILPGLRIFFVLEVFFI
jgi:hypothetical protein